MKKRIRKIWKKVLVYMSFPQTWLFTTILVMTVAAFFLSRNVHDEYWQSLFSNVFAGLITGLVISLLAGTRQIYFSVQERKKQWLKDLHKLILEYSGLHHKFLRNDYNGMDREEFIYEMGASVSWIGERVLQSTFDRRLPFNSEKYCKKHLNFDGVAFYDKSNKIHDSLCNNTYPEKEDVIELFEDVDRELRNLNSKVNDDIRAIEVKIATAQRSIT